MPLWDLLTPRRSNPSVPNAKTVHKRIPQNLSSTLWQQLMSTSLPGPAPWSLLSEWTGGDSMAFSAILSLPLSPSLPVSFLSSCPPLTVAHWE